MGNELLLHATALSNFALAFDKYTRVYDKARLPKNTFPGEFYLLTRDELDVGLRKATTLVSKLGIPGDQVVVMQVEVNTDDLRANLRTGKGMYVPRSWVKVVGLLEATACGLQALPIEEALARALKALHPVMPAWDTLRPRTFSVLPIARACQASCVFCFSEASVSSEQKPSAAFSRRVETLCRQAKKQGAERFVVTGGGEPGLLPHVQLLELLNTGRRFFEKTVLITNGVHLARLDENDRTQRLRDYALADLGVLSISRHHHDPAVNARIMALDTRTEAVLGSVRGLPEAYALRTRLVCVLQKGGIDSEEALCAYLDWAVERGVGEVCFKELYVSTTLESAYHEAPENKWALDNQVELALVGETLAPRGFTVASRLPWGAPVLTGTWRGKPLAVAAYTEPSVFWERTNGLVRSWNLMAEGDCLASLEDPNSHVCRPAGAVRKTIPIKAAR